MYPLPVVYVRFTVWTRLVAAAVILLLVASVSHVSAQATPAQPTNLTTTESLVQPTFNWTHDGLTLWYRLYVNGSIDEWFEASEICVDAACSVNPGVTLRTGPAQWWVNGWNDDGFGPWSDAAVINAPIATQWDGEITTTDPIWQRASAMCSGLSTTYVYYDVYPLYVDTTGSYTFETTSLIDIDTTDEFAADSYMLLYADSFNPVDPSTNCIGGDDDAGVGTASRINSNLTAGIQYYLVITQFSTLEGNGRPYGYTGNIYGAGTATLGPLPPSQPTNLIISESLVQPRFNWDHDGNTQWYHLYATGGINAWYEASTICFSEICSVNPGVTFSSGDHPWWVRGWNDNGFGPWSDEAPLTLPAVAQWEESLTTDDPTWQRTFSNCTGIRETPTLYDVQSFHVDTAGIYIMELSSLVPLNADNENGGDSYMLLYANIFNPLNPEGDCIEGDDDSGAGLASRITAVLAADTQYYLVTTQFSTFGNMEPTFNYTGNIYGDGTVTLGALPAEQPINLVIDESEVQPTFYWTHDGSTAWYRLYVTGGIDEWYEASTICNGVFCGINPGVTLTGGNYSWWVNGWNENGFSPWSSEATFTVPNATQWSSELTADDPIWERVNEGCLTVQEGAVAYEVHPFYVSVSGSYTVETTSLVDLNMADAYDADSFVAVYAQRFDASLPEADCIASDNDTGVGAASRAVVELTAGTQYYLIVTQYGWGGNAQATFAYTGNIFGVGTVTHELLPPSQPANLIADESLLQPIFTWDYDLVTAWYRVYIDSGLDEWYEASEICTGDVCRLDLGQTFDAGSYSWWVNGWNSTGFSPWSDEATFTTPESTQWSDALTTGDLTWQRVSGDCTIIVEDNPVFYDTRTFTVSMSGEYSVETTGLVDLNTNDAYPADSILVLYQDSFNPAEPLTNCLTEDDNSGSGLASRVTTTLNAGTSYVLVVSQLGWGNGTIATFDYTGHIYGPGDVVINAPAPGFSD